MRQGGLIRLVVGLITVVLLLLSPSAMAIGSSPVISHLNTGTTQLAKSEFVAIYNNSSQAVDVTDWCVQYSSASDVTKTNLACLEAPDVNTRLILHEFSYARFASQEFTTAVNGFSPDKVFAAGMSSTAGHIRLLDASKKEVDRVGWGVTAVNPEAVVSDPHVSGQMLVRKPIASSQFLQDLENNQQDFASKVVGEIPASGIYEEVQEIDVCSNLTGVQLALPVGYELIGGDCVKDICLNIDGLQIVLPDGYEESVNQTCQKIVPKETSRLVITELLPNVSGIDTGLEYVEIYNPNNYQVNIAGYRLDLDSSSPKSYVFKPQFLEPFSYNIFADILTGITLPNSSASLRLWNPNGEVVSETDVYNSPKDDQAWALFNDMWQFSDQPTPGTANLSSLLRTESSLDDNSLASASLVPCAANQYRNPETNRCKLLITGDEELKPCADDEVRSPETNRCRKTTTVSGLIPCKEGQERNPETSRCRSIVSTASAELKPCGEGEERNPETNRCRKVTTTLGASTVRPEVKDVVANKKPSNKLLLSGLVILVAGYGIYEWRHEILKFIRTKRLTR